MKPVSGAKPPLPSSSKSEAWREVSFSASATAGRPAPAFGQAAALYDFAASLRARAPWMVVTVMLAMFLVPSSPSAR